MVVLRYGQSGAEASRNVSAIFVRSAVHRAIMRRGYSVLFNAYPTDNCESNVCPANYAEGVQAQCDREPQLRLRVVILSRQSVTFSKVEVPMPERVSNPGPSYCLGL